MNSFKTRLLTGVAFVVAMVAGVYGHYWSFALLFTTIGAGCLWEFYGMVLEKNTPIGHRVLDVVPGVLLIGGGFALQSGYWSFLTEVLLLRMLIALFFLFFILELFRANEKPFGQMAWRALGIAYIAVPFYLLPQLACSTGDYVPHRVMGLLVLVWSNDTFAYLTGSLVGKTPFFPRISPKKTWEGTLGGIACTAILAWLAAQYFPFYSQLQWLLLAFIVGVFGTLGDLVESMLKRSF
ncbi:MAG TPA: phosphatidate cytidylyltransferase, partial [Saprospiraceae bacterium]|nr:phosphatidate cytidylyltransferase [Saprospiraceae bacterium]